MGTTFFFVGSRPLLNVAGKWLNKNHTVSRLVGYISELTYLLPFFISKISDGEIRTISSWPKTIYETKTMIM